MRFILVVAAIAAALFLAGMHDGGWGTTKAQAAAPRTASYCYWEYHYYSWCCDYDGNWNYVVTWRWVCR